MNFNQEQTKYLKIFVYGAISLFAITAVLAVAFTFSNLTNTKRITDAQVEKINKETERLEKPVIIEQRYIRGEP